MPFAYLPAQDSKESIGSSVKRWLKGWFVGLHVSGLTASKPVFTDASKNLTSSGTLGIDQGGTGQVTAALAFAALKQAATEAATGVVEIATDAEALAKTATDKALVPSNLAALGSSETFAGLTELATAAEAMAHSDTSRVVTPALAGLSTVIEQAGDANVTAAQMHGQTHKVLTTGTMTLPAVAAGLNARFFTVGAIAVHVKAGASDKIKLNGTELDDGDKITNSSTHGDMVEIAANEAGTDWQTGVIIGTWTDGGA